MLFEANDEIRMELERSARRKLGLLRQREPFAYLDWVINELEEFHVHGWKRVPKDFMPSLLAVREIKADGLRIPDRWPALIRDAIDKCFNLQEQLLEIRDPHRASVGADSVPYPDGIEDSRVEEAYATF